MRSSDYRNSAQKAGKSAGQRKRRQARDRKRQMREANLYKIAVRSSVVSDARQDDLAVYGVYEDDGEWVLTTMAVRRSEERLVSDRQGATKSEVCDKLVVTPRRGELRPQDGFEVSRFDSKSAAMGEVNADSSSRVDTGEYVVEPSDWNRTMNLHKVDRDEYREWMRSGCVRSVR